MKKLPAASYHFVMPLVLSGIMTMIVSAISIVRVAGLQNLSSQWLGAWLLSWLVAYPVLLCVLPLVRFLMRNIVEGQ